MPEEECETRGSSGLSGAGVGGAFPLTAGGVAAALRLGDDMNAVNAAVRGGMQAGAVSAAALAARKPAQVGAPMIAPPVAPVAAAPVAAPAAPIGAHQQRIVMAPDARLVTKLSTHTVPFCLIKEMSLLELSTGAVSAKNIFTIPLPMEGGARVVLAKLTVTHVESSSRLAMGLRLGNLPASRVASLPGRKQGGAFHVVVPRMDQPPHTKAQTVFTLSDMVDPNHVMAYSKYTSIEQLMAEVHYGAESGNYEVPLKSAIGYVLLKNAEKANQAVVHTAANGSKYIISPPEPVKAIAQNIHSEFIANKRFQNLLLKSDQFEAELVALNESGKFSDVPELSVEDEETQQRELSRRFRVMVCGTMDVQAVSADAACAL
jgi:hypothetical protein